MRWLKIKGRGLAIVCDVGNFQLKSNGSTAAELISQAWPARTAALFTHFSHNFSLLIHPGQRLNEKS